MKRSHTPKRRVFLVLIAAAVACGGSNAERESEHTPASNAELGQLFEEDQAARSGPLESVDMEALSRKDSAHRTRVRELADSGALRTGQDFHRAAMIFQHGIDSVAYGQAHRWALKSEALDSTNVDVRWLVAATWDRYQMSRRLPQWYGTQTIRKGGVGPVILYSIDTTQVTDAERIRRGIGTLAALRARADTINRSLGFPRVDAP